VLGRPRKARKINELSIDDELTPEFAKTGVYTHKPATPGLAIKKILRG
jgi:hypothetical protein